MTIQTFGHNTLHQSSTVVDQIDFTYNMKAAA